MSFDSHSTIRHREERERGLTEAQPDSAQPVVSTLDRFHAAMADVADHTMALSSAITDVLFAEAARLRNDVGHALTRAEAVAAGITDPAEQVSALHQLGEMHGVAFRLLQVAPAPSAGALAAAEVGDLALLIGEEQAWISERLALGTNPRLPAPQRARSPTIPATPRALRSAPGEHHASPEALPPGAPAAVPPNMAFDPTVTGDHRRSLSTDQVLDDESI